MACHQVLYSGLGGGGRRSVGFAGYRVQALGLLELAVPVLYPKTLCKACRPLKDGCWRVLGFRVLGFRVYGLGFRRR